jgi:hypothetical protein
MSTNGAFVSISDVTVSEANTAGHVKYVLATEFDKGPVTLTLTLKQDRDQIEGVFMESAESWSTVAADRGFLPWVSGVVRLAAVALLYLPGR